MISCKIMGYFQPLFQGLKLIEQFSEFWARAFYSENTMSAQADRLARSIDVWGISRFLVFWAVFAAFCARLVLVRTGGTTAQHPL